MNIMLVGAGAVTAGLVQKLMEQGHTIAAMLGQLTPSQLEIHNYSGVVVVSPETTTSTETLTKAAELGKLIYVIAGASDSISGWAATTLSAIEHSVIIRNRRALDRSTSRIIAVVLPA